MTDVKQLIEQKLHAAFDPSHLNVSDDSAAHAGHAGAREGGQSHFTVNIEAEAFSGKTRVMVHRLVNEALAEELAGPIHALAIKARAPQ